MAPHRGGFSPFTLIPRDLSDFGENGARLERRGEIRDPRIRGRLRRIFRKSRDFSANLRKCHRAPARWVCAIYSDFSGLVGIMRKRGLRGVGAKYATPPGSVAGCVWSSGKREIPRRISETDPSPPRGGFAPRTRISPDLSEFGENGVYVVRRVQYATTRIRGRLRRIFRKSRDFPANLRDFHRALARQSCAIYSDFSGPFGIRRIRPLRGAGWRNMRPPGPWSVA